MPGWAGCLAGPLWPGVGPLPGGATTVRLLPHVTPSPSGLNCCIRLFRPSACLPCRFTEGIYVLYTYTANPAAGQAVQKYLSTPQAGAELNILRHMTFRL